VHVGQSVSSCERVLPLPALRQAVPLRRLPLVTLYLTERCNSRCVSCDYWRHGKKDLELTDVARLLPSFEALGTQVVLLSGGEPLLNPAWADIAQLLRSRGLKLWLLTSGLALAKHAARAAKLFDAITVSLDGTTPHTYAAIRGLNAFARVCTGIRAAASAGAAVSVRVTVQRANFRELPQFVPLTRALGARQVSFVAVDVANPHAFARSDDFASDLALTREELPQLRAILHDLEHGCAEDIRTGFIAESARKLARLAEYFGAVCGENPYPSVRCNVFDYSAVISASGAVSPCFFIPGPAQSHDHSDLEHALNSGAMRRLRAGIRDGARAECATCVCSLWRDGGERRDADFLLR
jgi:Fe-coproporphyrin III synthase